MGEVDVLTLTANNTGNNAFPAFSSDGSEGGAPPPLCCATHFGLDPSAPLLLARTARVHTCCSQSVCLLIDLGPIC